jgi:hypothetical protein
MFGHNPLSWVNLSAETILGFKMEGDGDSADYWKTYPNSSADAPANWDEWTHDENGWVADGCEARFYLSKGSGDSISIAYPLDSAYNTGEWYKPTANGEGGATSINISGIQDGELYIDAYTRAMMIVGNHWDGDTDSEIATIQTIAQPLFGLAKWTWISGLNDLPTNCGVDTSCTYSQWSEWSSCQYNDAAEGQYRDGLQTRTRQITGGTTNCDGELSQTQPCIIPTDCEWGAWSAWSAWSIPCGYHNNGESTTRTRTRSVTKPHKGGQAEDLCPAGIVEGFGWGSTQTETETKNCPSSASDCESGEEWYEGTTFKDGQTVAIGKCDPPQPCDKGWDETTTETDAEGCKTGCKSGFKEIKPAYAGLGCQSVGCTDPLAKNYDSTATLACNQPTTITLSGGYDYYGTYGTNIKPTNNCCKYDCDNPLLETDWRGKCTDTCIDGYLMNSAGVCEEQCNEGFELIDGECKKIPKVGSDDKITTQNTVSAKIEPKSANMAPLVGGIAILGALGMFLLRK